MWTGLPISRFYCGYMVGGVVHRSRRRLPEDADLELQGLSPGGHKRGSLVQSLRVGALCGAGEYGGWFGKDRGLWWSGPLSHLWGHPLSRGWGQSRSRLQRGLSVLLSLWGRLLLSPRLVGGLSQDGLFDFHSTLLGSGVLRGRRLSRLGRVRGTRL